jgi:hypothetical protein
MLPCFANKRQEREKVAGRRKNFSRHLLVHQVQPANRFTSLLVLFEAFPDVAHQQLNSKASYDKWPSYAYLKSSFRLVLVAMQPTPHTNGVRLSWEHRQGRKLYLTYRG